MTTAWLINPWEKTIRQVEGDWTDLETIYRWLSQKDEDKVDTYGEWHMPNGDMLYYDENGGGKDAFFKITYTEPPDRSYYDEWWGRCLIVRHDGDDPDKVIPPKYTREELLKMISWPEEPTDED